MKKTASKKIELAIRAMLDGIIESYCDGCDKKFTTCSKKCELWKFSDFLSGVKTEEKDK